MMQTVKPVWQLTQQRNAGTWVAIKDIDRDIIANKGWLVIYGLKETICQNLNTGSWYKAIRFDPCDIRGKRYVQ